jgi:hypothetical protein
MADVLGSLARIEFARIENTPMNDATPADARRQVEDRLTLALPTLLGLGLLGQSRLSEEIAPAAIDGVFNLLAEVGAKRLAGDDDLALPARAVRLHVGHELTDVHERYDGQMTDGELKAFATAPLPPGVNWSLLKTIDFGAFAARQPKGGRPRRSSLQ